MEREPQHLRIGITGGIGVGKSTVCNIFRQLRIPIYDADSRAKFLMNSSEKLIADIRKNFGWDAYSRNNELNREYLAKVVFSNPEKLALLNSLVHPRVKDDYEEWLLENKTHAYSLKEAALLFESKTYKNLHKVIVVTCPIDIRMDRIMKRDHVKREDVLKRIQNQMTDRERLKLADYTILNDGNHSLIEQSLKIHHEICAIQRTETLALKCN